MNKYLEKVAGSMSCYVVRATETTANNGHEKTAGVVSSVRKLVHRAKGYHPLESLYAEIGSQHRKGKLTPKKDEAFDKTKQEIIGNINTPEEYHSIMEKIRARNKG